jgi:hypothetical protein
MWRPSFLVFDLLHPVSQADYEARTARNQQGIVPKVGFINATAQGLRFNVTAGNQLGIAWRLPTYGVPAFTVAQVMVIAGLLTRGRQCAAGDRERAVDVPERLTASIS